MANCTNVEKGAIFCVLPNCAELSARNTFLSLPFNKVTLTLNTQFRHGLLYGFFQLSCLHFQKTLILSFLSYASCFIVQGLQTQISCGAQHEWAKGRRPRTVENGGGGEGTQCSPKVRSYYSTPTKHRGMYILLLYQISRVVFKRSWLWWLISCVNLIGLRDIQIVGKMLFLGVSMRVSLEEISIRISRLSKDHPHQDGGHHPTHQAPK